VGLGYVWVVASYRDFCPVAQALELVGDRWSLLVVRELLCGSRRFGVILRGIPRLPRSMLARRLGQLEAAKLVSHQRGRAGAEYFLTDAGAALEEVLAALGSWARRHAHRRLRQDQIDPGLLMWNVQRDIDRNNVPGGLLVVRMEFTRPRCPIERYWLKIQDGVGELCLTNPGLEETLVVRTSARAFAEVWLGHRDFRQAIAEGSIRVDGPRRLVAGFPSWFLLNTFVRLEHQTLSDGAGRT
jgi:DNA-binding HxlR family transcriptional regulator